MLPPFGGQLPDTLVILADQPGPDQESLDDLADRAGRQCQSRCQDVQPVRPFGQDAEVLLFIRAKAQVVDFSRPHAFCKWSAVIVVSPSDRQTRWQDCSRRSASRGVPLDRWAIWGTRASSMFQPKARPR